jgi:hypothetical protein
MNDQFDEEMRSIARGMLPPAPTINPTGNGTRHPVSEPQAKDWDNPRPGARRLSDSSYDFEEFGRKVSEGLVQAAKEQLLQAENMLKQSEAFAEDMRARVSNKASELSDLNNRLKIFATSILAAHQAFNSEPASDDANRS